VPNQNRIAKFLIRNDLQPKVPKCVLLLKSNGLSQTRKRRNYGACYVADLIGFIREFRSGAAILLLPLWHTLPHAAARCRFPYNLSMANPSISGAGSNPAVREARFYRKDGRAANQLRPLELIPGFVRTAEGSVLISVGHTRVLCNATIENGVPGWLRNSGRGWVTAEYAMLPRATVTRTARESERGKIGGRTHEIQRLIGRSLRSVVDMQVLGERTVTLDCDVIQADGGTRTAAITGACVALALALDALVKAGTLAKSPLKQLVSATSVGIVEGAPLLDLCYEEDSQAEVDMNVVVTADGGLVETQATAERRSYSRAQLNQLLDLAESGLAEIFTAQRKTLGWS
jgi:ribonuclease PH